MTTVPLRETDHPYYCQEGNYFKNGQHLRYGSWAEFYEEWGTLDGDYNAVFRWDWQRPDPDDYEPGEPLGPDLLKIYWVLQRKAILRSTECVITEADEPAVREWLATKARGTALRWEPFLALADALADRAAVLREAADALAESERLRDLTDDHMHDVNAAANELRRMADEAQQP